MGRKKGSAPKPHHSFGCYLQVKNPLVKHFCFLWQMEKNSISLPYLCAHGPRFLQENLLLFSQSHCSEGFGHFRLGSAIIIMRLADLDLHFPLDCQDWGWEGER